MMTNRFAHPHFSLSQVLRIREIAVEREERALERILAEMTRVRAAIELADQAIRAAVADRERDLRVLLHGSHLHASCHHAHQLRRHRGAMMEQLGRLEAECAAQTRAWEAAHQRREVLTGMRDAHQAARRLGQARMEQQAADEGFLSRFHAK